MDIRAPLGARLAVMMYVRFPLSLRNVEDLFHERGIDESYETVRAWCNRFGPVFAAEIRKRRSKPGKIGQHGYRHLDEVFVRINGETHYFWRAVDHEGVVLKVFVTKRWNCKAALLFLRKTIKRYGIPKVIVTDKLWSYRAAMKEIGNEAGQETGRRFNNRAESSHQPFRRRERAMAKFRNFTTLQKFISVHSSIHNHFNNQRHLERCYHFKESCSQALAEWRRFVA